MVGVEPSNKAKGRSMNMPMRPSASPVPTAQKKPVEAMREALSWRFAPNSREI